MSNEEKELMKLSEPTRLTNMMVNRPCCVVLISFTIMILISAFVAFMGWLQPNDPNDRDYLVWGDEYVTKYDMAKLAKKVLATTETDEFVPL